MNRTHPIPVWIFIPALLATIACNLVKVVMTPTPADIPTQPLILPTEIQPQVILPTDALLPIVENTPMPTAEIFPAQAEDPIMAEVQDYYSKGYLPYPNGELTLMPDFSFTQPGNDVHDLTRTKFEAQDFALWADIELNTVLFNVSRLNESSSEFIRSLSRVSP